MADEKPKAEYTVKANLEDIEIILTFGSSRKSALAVKSQLEAQDYTVKVMLIKEVQ